MIFMIHGMWGGAHQWRNWIDFFEQRGRRCIAVTLPFHDVSPSEPPDPALGSTSVLDYADFLEGELNRLDEKPIIMGHSMGGLLAQILGSRGYGKALVLLTPAAPSGCWCVTPSVTKSFWSTLTKWGFWEKPQRPKFHEAVYAMMHTMPEQDQKDTYAQLVYESGRVVFEIGFWYLDNRDATVVDESKVTQPVLVVAGAEDRITPAWVVRQVARKYGPVSTYKEFPGQSHMVFKQPGWQDMAGFVNEWIKRNGM
jgi:pimeloyl-ACP methyl ester carboxylesterase